MGFSLLPRLTSPADGNPILVLADPADTDILCIDCDHHWTTSPTSAHERVAHTPCHPVVQRVDHGETDRVLGSWSAGGSSSRLRSFRLCVRVWVWVGFARVR